MIYLMIYLIVGSAFFYLGIKRKTIVEDEFMTPIGYVSFHNITNVMPINKPEPPR